MPHGPSRRLKPKTTQDPASMRLSCLLDEAATAADSDVETDEEVIAPEDPCLHLPPEQLEQDQTLVQEMEMDRHIWLKCFGLTSWESYTGVILEPGVFS